MALRGGVCVSIESESVAVVLTVLLCASMPFGCGEEGSFAPPPGGDDAGLELSGGRQLTHAMQPWERALMPSYLHTVRRTETARYRVAQRQRQIAEFEPMEGVLIRYPLGIPLAVVKEMAENTTITTIVHDAYEEGQARSSYSNFGVNLDNCHFLHAPSDSMWTRDYAPWYVRDGVGNINILDFTYNRPRPRDNDIPAQMATFLGVELHYMDLVHAGGNFMTTGIGVAASTDLVWEENASLTEQQIAQILGDHAGIDTYHVTEDPLGAYIKHIDCWGKFLDVDKVLITEVPTSHANYDKFEDVAAYFASQVSAWGTPYEIYRVYSPNGEPYTNSLILNDKVLVPISDSTADQDAIVAYQNAMPGYEVLGFTGDWYTEDALHCRTKGIADRDMVHIEHQPLHGSPAPRGVYRITAEITPYSGADVDLDATAVHYRVDGGAFNVVPMTHAGEKSYSATLPELPAGSEVGYYIAAADTAGNTNRHPLIGPADPHLFTVGELGCRADFSHSVADLTVTFRDASSSAAGRITAWHWTFGDGQSASVQNPTHTYLSEGTITVELEATDSAGYSCANAKQIRVGNQAPIADFNFVTDGLAVTFRDTSRDDDGEVVGWLWDFGDGATSTAQHPSHSYTSFTSYTVTLTVTDDGGKNAHQNRVVPVLPNYCSARARDFSYEWIAQVEIDSFSHASEGTSYSDFTANIIELTKGAAHSVSLTPGFSSSSYNESWRVWLDFNRDGDWEDAGEEIFGGSGQGNVTGSFQVPTTAADGHTRLRVAMRYSQTPPLCGDYDYGEVEDYTVNLNADRLGRNGVK